MMQLSEISFDEHYGRLFQVADARLRADALKHSLLPRLQTMLHEAMATIRNAYGLEALDDSIVSKYPNFRQTRPKALELLQTLCDRCNLGKSNRDATDLRLGAAGRNLLA